MIGRKFATVCFCFIRFSNQFGRDEMNSEEDEEEPTRNQLQEIMGSWDMIINEVGQTRVII